MHICVTRARQTSFGKTAYATYCTNATCAQGPLPLRVNLNTIQLAKVLHTATSVRACDRLYHVHVVTASVCAATRVRVCHACDQIYHVLSCFRSVHTALCWPRCAYWQAVSRQYVH